MSGHGVPHHAENAEQKRIGIFVAILAVILAVVTALANNQANLMTISEIRTSDYWAAYQAKRQRSYMNELEMRRSDIDLAGNVTDAQRKLIEDNKARLKAKNAEYEKDNLENSAKAKSFKGQAEAAAHKHHSFERAEVLIHIAIVLASLTLLTEMKIYFRLSIAITILGVVLGVMAFIEKPHHGDEAAEGAPPAASAAPTPATH